MDFDTEKIAWVRHKGQNVLAIVPKSRRERRKALTRGEVLTWGRRRGWDVADRRRVAAALDAFDGYAHFIYTPLSSQYVAVEVPSHLHGQGSHYIGLYIHPGRLQWPLGVWNADLDPELFPKFEDDAEMHSFGQDYYVETFALSTSRPAGERLPRTSSDGPLRCCPICQLELPTTGVCGNC